MSGTCPRLNYCCCCFYREKEEDEALEQARQLKEQENAKQIQKQKMERMREREAERRRREAVSTPLNMFIHCFIAHFTSML